MGNSVLDIRLVRENPDLIRRDLAKRGAADKARLLEDVIRKDREWRDDLQKLEALRKRRNEITREIDAATRRRTEPGG